MRKLKIFILTALTMASLFSVRDKEVVITVPDTKPLIAEAYHQPDQTPGFTTPTTQGQQPKPSPGTITSLSQANNDSYYNYSTPPAQVEEFSTFGSQPLNSPPPSNPVTPDNKTETPAATNNQQVFLGLGGFVGDGGNGDEPVPQGAPGGPNTAPVINSFNPPTDPVPEVDEGASLDFSISATDPNGDTLTYSWKVDAQTVAGATSRAYSYTPEAGTAGTTKTITAVVSDGTTPVEQVWTVNITNPGTTVSISRIMPESGAQGVDIVIQGAGFSSTSASNIVKFSSTQSSHVEAIPGGNQLRAEVPAGLSPGFKGLSVTVNNAASRNYLFDALTDSSANIFEDMSSELLQGLPSQLLQGLNIKGVSIAKPIDFDNDKDIDLFVIHKEDDGYDLLINDGTGTFADGSAKLPTFRGVSNPSSLTDAKAGDLDNDGYPDIVLIYSSGQAVRVLMNGASGNGRAFNDMTSSNIPSLSENAVKCDLGDVNGNGSLDVIIACKDSKDILLLNDGTGKFTKDASFNLPAVLDGSSDIRFCDVDGDGDLDIITANSEVAGNEPLRNRIYINDGSGHFTDDTDTTNRIPAGGKNTEALDIGDINKDKAMDIVFADGLQNSVLINNGQGVFTDETLQRAPFNNVFSSQDMKLGDLNGDGNLDLIVLGESSVSLYMNDGTGKFNIDVSIKLPEYISSPALRGGAHIELADLDGDGSLDIVIGGNALYILMSSSENKAPVLAPIGDKQAAVGTNLTFNVTASDPNGDQFDLLAEGVPGGPLPNGATFQNGTFNWTPVSADPGTRKVKFIAREKGQNPLEDSEEINIEVLSNVPPELAVTPSTDSDVTLNYGESVVFAAYATDPDTPIGITWVVDGQDFTGTPDGISILSVAFGSGTHTVVVTATDGRGASSSETWTVKVYRQNQENHAPVIVSTTPDSPTTIYVQPGGTAQQTFRVTEYNDPDNPAAGQTLTFKWERKNTAGNYETIPGSGNAASAMVGLGLGRHFIKVTLTDSASPSASTYHEWDVTVQETTGNHAPVIVSTTPPAVPGIIYVQPGGSAQQTFRVTEYNDPDNPAAGQTLTFKWERKNAAGNYETIPGSGNAASAMVGLGLGRHFIKVTLTDDGSPVMSDTSEWDVTVQESATTYTLTVNAANGTVARNPDKTTYNNGEQVQLTAAPNAGYYFSGWSDDLSGTTNPETVTMDGNKTVTANFAALPPLTITASAGPGGTINPSGDVTVPYGGDRTFTITADTGYHIDQVLVDGVAVTLINGTHTFSNVTANHTIAASFTLIPTYTLTVNASNGTVVKNPDKTTYNSGEQVQLTAAPNTGYSFSGWSDDLSGTNNPETITMNGNKTVTANFTANQPIEDQIIQQSFPYFWKETDNPETGFVRDRVTVNPNNRTSDPYYNKASMAATGFGLAAMCVAYNDPAVWSTISEDETTAKTAIRDRVSLIITRLLEIQGKQSQDQARWGKDGYFYHYVYVAATETTEAGERWKYFNGASWELSEVSTIDTAILVAGALTAGKYFGGDIEADALLLYKNVNWKAFLDLNPTVPNHHLAANPNYNQIYMSWTPEDAAWDGQQSPPGQDAGRRGHWDYNNEGLLIYLLAVCAPEISPGVTNAIPPETFYAFRRELGNYGPEGNPFVKSWFGTLFVYQYTQAFFNFKDSNTKNGNPLYDMQGVDWWDNSVEATKANKRFCNDSINKFAGQADLWGLTSGYTSGFAYELYGAAPYGITPPPADVRGADGTVFPAAPAGSIPFLENECKRALDKMKELYDVYGHPVWGDYGFVSSFKLGPDLNTLPNPISIFYCGIDTGISLVMAENNKSGLIWDNFSKFPIDNVTLRDKLTQLLNLTAGAVTNITVDDIGPASNFRMGKIDPQHTLHEIRFDMASKLNGPYLFAVHSFMETPGQKVTVGVKVNGTDLPDVVFEYPAAGKEFDLVKYIDIDSQDLKAGQGADGANTIMLEWKSGTSGTTPARWLAWKNIEISSPAEHNTWSLARDNSTNPNPQLLFGNEYRVDDTYFIGADVSSFEQAINKDVEKFTDILFYTTAQTVDYAALTLKALETQDNKMTNVEVYINGAKQPIFSGQISTGQPGGDQIMTTGFDLRNGWNRITIYHPGKTDEINGEWVRWDRISIAQVERPTLNPPAEFVAASFGNNKIKLRWKSVNSAATYKIYRSDTANGSYTTPIAVVDAPNTSYEDTGLDSNKTYYYVSRAVKLDNSESEKSAEVNATTGSYRIDYGDGHEPNTFGGNTLDNGGAPPGDNAYTDEVVRYNGTGGKVRKVVLSGAGMKNSIRLNNADINDATMLSFRVMSVTADTQFRITLWDNDAVPHSASVSLKCPTAGMWQSILYVLSSTFGNIDFTKIDAIEIASESAGQITLYFDEIDFNIISLSSDYLDVKIRDRFTDALATGLSFGTNAAGTGYMTAGQYIDVDYQCSGNWYIIIVTDNMASDAYPKYSGIYEPNKLLANGLIGVQNSGYRVPMVWQVFQTKKYTSREDLPPWGDFYQTGYVVDKLDWDYNKDQYSLPYRTILRYNGDLGFPLDPAHENFHLKGDVNSPLYVYLGADFSGAPAQDYMTGKLTIEIYHE